MDSTEDGLAPQIQVLQNGLNTEDGRGNHLGFSQWETLAKTPASKPGPEIITGLARTFAQVSPLGRHRKTQTDFLANPVPPQTSTY